MLSQSLILLFTPGSIHLLRLFHKENPGRPGQTGLLTPQTPVRTLHWEQQYRPMTAGVKLWLGFIHHYRQYQGHRADYLGRYLSYISSASVLLIRDIPSLGLVRGGLRSNFSTPIQWNHGPLRLYVLWSHVFRSFVTFYSCRHRHPPQ